MTITGRRIRDACALLRWDRSTTGRRTALPTSVIGRAEAVNGEPHVAIAQQIAIKLALAGAGVEFLTDLPRVRLRIPSTVNPDEV